MLDLNKKLSKQIEEETLEEYVKDILDESVILFLIRKEYGEIKTLAKICGVSEKMIYLYINHYYLPRIEPKFHRKEQGGYKTFKSRVNRLVKRFIKFIEEKAHQLNIDEKAIADLLIDFIKKEV